MLSHIFFFTIAGIMLLLPPRQDFTVIIKKSFIFAVVLGSLITLLLYLVDKPGTSVVILKDNMIEFKGKRTTNSTLKLSEFDRLSYHEGLLFSYIKLERDKGEPPNWYKAVGTPADRDKAKLEKMIKIANNKINR